MKIHPIFFVRLIFAGLVVMCCTSLSVRAQGEWEKEGEGEIKDVEIEIVKDRQIVLPRASRNFDKVPPRPYQPIEPAITYSFKNLSFTAPDFKPVVRPLKLKQEELSKIYGNYLSAGVGNYSSFFVEGSVTTKRDKNKYLGAHLYSRTFGTGPVDDEKSASSVSRLQLFGKHMGKAVTVNGDGNYERIGAYFYGYNPALDINRDRIRQTYETYRVKASLENTIASDFNYSLQAGYSYLFDHYKANEGEFSLGVNTDYKFSEKGKFMLGADYFLINRNDRAITSSARHLFRAKPAYRFSPIDKLFVTAGINLALQSDKFPGSKDISIYPNVKAQYDVSPSFELYGLVTGDIDKVNLHSLSGENLWLNSNISVLNTNRALEAGGGLNAKIGRKVAVGAGVTIASLKNYYYYLSVRNDLDMSGNSIGSLFDKFNVVYDENTQRTNAFAEISFTQAETFRLSVRADHFGYNTKVLADAWHRPTYRMSIISHVNMYDKVTLDAGFILQGGMKSLDPVSGTILTLDAATDLNVKARYFISKQVSAFLQFNNMLGSAYPLFQSYPVRGFQAMGGVSWAF